MKHEKIRASLKRLLDKADKAGLILYVFDSGVYLTDVSYDGANFPDHLIDTNISCDGGAGV